MRAISVPLSSHSSYRDTYVHVCVCVFYGRARIIAAVTAAYVRRREFINIIRVVCVFSSLSGVSMARQTPCNYFRCVSKREDSHTHICHRYVCVRRQWCRSSGVDGNSGGGSGAKKIINSQHYCRLSNEHSILFMTPRRRRHIALHYTRSSSSSDTFVSS